MSVLYRAVLALLTGALFVISPLAAQSEKGHYVLGAEGIKAASLPPPGVYFRSYNFFYNAGTLKNGDGDELPVNFDVSVFATAERLIWITDKKILGGYFGMDAILPFVRTDVSIGALGVDDNQFALGDMFFEPITISWHGAQYDAAVGLGFYAPTGKYSMTEPASAGMDFWTTMLTFGATAYLDQAKLWNLSLLGRYEINGEKDETQVKPGQDLVLEYGLAKTVCKFWDLGLAGYAVWQVTDDDLPGSAVNTVHDRVYAIGPEASVFIMPAKAFLSLRALYEFGAQDRSQGSTITLTFTKIL